MGRFKKKAQQEPVTLRLTRPLGENLTPKDFEVFVKEQFESWGYGLEGIEVKHLDKLSAYDGDYEVDVTARFRAFGGAKFLCLIECRHHKNPIKRRDLKDLLTTLRSVGAQKGIMVSTSGFQSGAIKFALAHSIATITIAGGSFATYATMFPFH